MPKFLKLSERLLGEKTILENGTYAASADSLDGFSQVIVRVESSGGGGVTEIATAEEMGAFKSEANVGKYAKYVGESTDTYTNGAIYFVKQEGGNIALFNQSTFDSEMGAFMQLYDAPLTTPFTNGESVNINFKVNGGETQSVASTWVDQGGMTMIAFDGSSPQTIYQDDNVMVMFMGYCSTNMSTSAEGQSYMCMVMSLATNAPATDYVVEVLSFSNANGEVSNPVTFNFDKFFSLPAPTYRVATANDIRANVSAYNEKGEHISGSLQNPEVIRTQEELANAINGDSGAVYRLEQTIGDYGYGVYTSVSQGGIRELQQTLTLNDIGDNYSIQNKVRLTASGYYRPYAYAYCNNLTTVDFKDESNALSLAHHLFYGCTSLEKVIIRTPMQSTIGEGVFDNTLIASGSGYIYVHDSLVDTLKTAENWSTYASQIKPLSEYVEETV